MGAASFGSIVNILREVNLAAIKKEAEQRWTLLVSGEATLAQRLAEQLSAEPGKIGVHPWLHVAPAPLPTEIGELRRFTMALIVSDSVTLSEASGATVQRLVRAGVPTLVVVVHAEAERQVGAELPRQGEVARVLLPDLFPATVQATLVPTLLEPLGSLRLALARQLPALRPPVAQLLVEETARANALYAASTGLAEVFPVLNLPLNAADILILTKNQLVMAYKIALLAGKEGEPTDIMGEVVGVIGGGFLFRQIARQLVGLIPVVGIVPKVTVAYAGTWVIGRAVFLWATEGQALNTAQLSHFYAEALERGRALAERLTDRTQREVPVLPDPDGPPTALPDLALGEPPAPAARPGCWGRLRALWPFGRERGQ